MGPGSLLERKCVKVKASDDEADQDGNVMHHGQVLVNQALPMEAVRPYNQSLMRPARVAKLNLYHSTDRGQAGNMSL